MRKHHLITGLVMSVAVIVGVGAQTAPAVAQNVPGYSSIADFTGDGRADLGDHWGATGSFWIRKNNGNGTFEPFGNNWGSGTTSAPLGDWRVLAADFTGDGFADYADHHVPSGQVWIHANLQNGTFGATWGYGTVEPGSEVVAGDLNADGRADLLDFYWGPLYRYYPNLGGGTSFSPASAQTVTWVAGPPHLGTWRRPILADVDGDNCDDVVIIFTTSASFNVFRNNCHPTILQFFPTAFAGGAGFGHPSFTTVFGDFTGDGYADYADVNLDTGEIWVHNNLGPGASFTFNSGNWAYGIYSSAPGYSILGLPAFFF